MSRTVTLCALVLIALFLSKIALAIGTTISGHTKDAETDKPLPGANIILKGTAMGTASDIDGSYVIHNVPPGSYTIKISYIGYKEEEIKLTIKPGENIKQNFSLKPISVEGKTVVITSQASGQKQAINRQLTSDQIINVVSSAKIQELPDANASESVGRLPGVTVLRSGGEGTKVVIRGLEPKYNRILIGGVEMASSDPDDRSTDLSMISSNMLESIEVSKTVTPDMDANVLGGTVNFKLREAKVKEPGVPEFEFLVQGGYNNLSNVYNKLNNYKYVISGEDRFLNSRFGVLAQLGVERKNLSSNEMGAAYTHAGNSQTQYYTTGLNLYDIPRDRKRYNAALVLDYRMPEGKIKLTNFLSSGNTNTISRQETFNIVDNQHSYGITSQNSTLNTISNSIEFEQQLPIFKIKAGLSHTYSETNNPTDWSVNFLQTSAGLGQFNNVSNVNPVNIPNATNNDLSSTLINLIATNSSFSRERALTASLDLLWDFNISELVSGNIKFGGKYRYQKRSYEYDEYNGGGLQFGGAAYVNDLIISHFAFPPEIRYNITIPYFIDPNFDYGEFLGGNYKMVAPLNLGMLSEIANLMRNNASAIAANNGSTAYGHNNLLSTTNDYAGHEDQTGFYVMSVLNIGPQITIIPGVRYQNLQTTYTGIRGIESRVSFDAYNHYDTTVIQNHGYWLPDVSLRYKPLSWFDVRLSYTNTLSYPDFDAIIPRINVGTGTIAWNNYKLIPSRSTNYDLYLSFYNNSIGLFTAGAFFKQIDNLIYPWTFYVSGSDASQYFPQSLLESTPRGTYAVNTFVNNSYRIDDYGAELDWQTHFWYLPGPLSGLVLGVNYTHIFSKAEYPFVYISSDGRNVNYIDTSFTDRLLYQPNDIVNLSLGFDYRGFSLRVSMLYQTDIFTGPNFWPQLRSHTSAYKRWDLAFKQQLPWFNLQLFGALNNINGARDISVLSGGGVPTSEQDYGLTASFGLRCNF